MSWRPLPSADDDGPRRIGDSVRRVARSLGAPAPEVANVLFAGWQEAVGETVALHARPVSLRDGVLVVAVDEPAWATQLRFLEREILERLADSAGSLVAERIDVRVRPGRGPKARNSRS